MIHKIIPAILSAGLFGEASLSGKWRPEIAPFQLNPSANAQTKLFRSVPTVLPLPMLGQFKKSLIVHFFFRGGGLIKVSFGLHYLNIKYPHFLLLFIFFSPNLAKSR